MIKQFYSEVYGNKNPYERKVRQYFLAGLALTAMRVWYGIRIKLGHSVMHDRYNFFFNFSPMLLALVRIETELKYMNDHLGIENKS